MFVIGFVLMIFRMLCGIAGIVIDLVQYHHWPIVGSILFGVFVLVTLIVIRYAKKRKLPIAVVAR